MRKILALLFIMLLPSSSVRGQYWDTAPELIQTYTKQDTTRLQMLYQMMQFNNMRHFKDNLVLLQEAEKITEIVNTPQFEARLLINKAEQKILQGYYKDALEILLPAFPILEKHPSKKDEVHAAILLSEIDRENDNLDKVIKDLSREIGELDPFKDSFLLGWLHLTVANVHLNFIHNDYERFLKSMYHLDQSNQYFKKVLSKTGMGLVQAKYARFYKNSSFRKENSPSQTTQYHEKAIAYANQSLQTFYKFNQAQNIAYALYQKATAYSIVGNHKASVPVYQEAVQYYEEDGSLIWLKRLHQHLFVAHSILGEQETALLENKKFVQIKDSIFGIEKRQLLAEAETKFNTAQLKAQKEQAELKSNRNKNYAFGLGAIFILTMLSSIFFFGRMQAKKKATIISLELQETQKRLALEKQYRDSELKALKAQMNPHFIFNALNSIQEYIILNQKNLASDYLGKFADLMRKYLNHSDAGYISIQEEIESLKMYLELEALRFEDSLQYDFEVAPGLHDEFTKIPTMLVQPYVENAIKHGLLHKKENRLLKVQFNKKNENTITCIIEDNGVGRKRVAAIQKKSHQKRKGFATQATQSRLELLNFNRKEKIGISIIDLYDNEGQALGTQVQLSIPIKTT